MLNYKYRVEEFQNDTIKYRGKGGYDFNSKQFESDHLNVDENRAMINSYENNMPIRVVIGPNFASVNIKNKEGKYLYHGLFRITSYKYESEIDTNGFKVFNYFLDRIY